MKLKQLIKENVADKANIEKYLEENWAIDGDYTIDANGINVNGSAILTSSRYKELPFKFYKVTGDFDLSGEKIESLKNFPALIGETLLMQHLPIKNYKNEYVVETSVCNISGADSFINFLNFDIKAKDAYVIYNCENFKSLDGLERFNTPFLTIEACSNFTDDITKYNSMITVIEPSSNFPLIKPVLFNKQLNLVNRETGETVKEYQYKFENADPILESIINKYQSKGIKNIFDMIRELEDKGFSGNSVIDLFTND